MKTTLLDPDGKEVVIDFENPGECLREVMSKCFNTPNYAGDETDVTIEVVFTTLRKNGWTIKK
jgi:hypothetical protein